MTRLYHKLLVSDKMLPDFEGKVFSFTPSCGAELICLEDDPFLSVKNAVCSTIGKPCLLLRNGTCFFSDLFISLYEQLSMSFLEIKDHFKAQTQAFLEKKEQDFYHLKFQKTDHIKTIIIGKSSSLLNDIDLILEHQSSCLIVAAYSSLPILKQHGIHCDIAFAFDPIQTIHDSTNASVLAVAPKTSGKILQGFPKVALFPETWCGFSNYLYWHTPHPPIYGYTIVDTCLKFLIQSGLKEFYLSGVSLEELGGLYADFSPCGYKPDFKKAKEHIESLKMYHGGIYQLNDLAKGTNIIKEELFVLEPFETKEAIHDFDVSLKEALKLDLKKIGLYEMFLLEQSPFYQVVLEPLYNKWLILQCDQALDKRDFFEFVLKQYAKDFYEKSAT